MDFDQPTREAFHPSALSSLGAEAAAAAARLVKDLLDGAEAAARGEGPRRRKTDPLQGSAALLRAEVEVRIVRLQALSAEADRVAARLNGGLAEVRTVRMKVCDEAARGLLSGRIAHLEACRQSVAVARGLLLELVTTERQAGDQLSTGDIADVLALRQTRMLMLTERARRFAAEADEIDEAARRLEAAGRGAGSAPVVTEPLRRQRAAG